MSPFSYPRELGHSDLHREPRRLPDAHFTVGASSREPATEGTVRCHSVPHTSVGHQSVPRGKISRLSRRRYDHVKGRGAEINDEWIGVLDRCISNEFLAEAKSSSSQLRSSTVAVMYWSATSVSPFISNLQITIEGDRHQRRYT